MAQRITFSPEFSGRVFKGIEGSRTPAAKMDWRAMGLASLIGHIESLMGLMPCETRSIERLVEFYKAARQHLAGKKESGLGKSFALSGLNTAREMLRWRDDLAFCGYTFDSEDVSERIASLNAIEAIFRNSPLHDGIEERAWAAIRWIESQKADAFADHEIAITTPADLCHPTVGRLLKALREHGAHVYQMPPAPDNALADKSCGEMGWVDAPSAHKIHFLHFTDKKDADEYLTLYGEAMPNPWGDPASPTLWINQQNNTADNWLARYGKSRTGSTTSDSATLISQLLPLAIKVHREPLDVQCLLDWLQMPISPIEGNLRHKLAEKIGATGGFRNDFCRALIADYIESTPEEKRGKVEMSVEIYLPSQESTVGKEPPADSMPKEKLLTLLDSLSRWAAQRANHMSAQSDTRMWTAPLINLQQHADAMQLLAESADGDTVDWPTIESWISSLQTVTANTQYVAQVGCRTTVMSPADIADVSDLTLWANLVGDAPQERDCDFLTADERRRLSPVVNFWDLAKEDDFINRQLMLPLAMSRRIIIVYYDFEYGQPVNKYPLILQLEGRYDGQKDMPIGNLTTTGMIDPDDEADVPPLDNQCDDYTARICSPENLTWPAKLSYTALDQVINHPVDFVMERMLKIKATPRAELDDLRVARGQVAHAVIAAICLPRDGELVTTPAQMENRIKEEYDGILERAIEECGAMLGRTEERLDTISLGEQLRECLEALREIIALNHLEVTDCEKSVSSSLTLLDEESDEDDVSGFIDMTLRDTTDGSNVIFDFKWTRSPNRYRSTLLDNRSIQLELYKQILTNIEHKRVSRVAYFIMPAGRLLSQDKFDGYMCDLIEPTSNKDADVVRQIVNSFHYRKEQIDKGIVELGEGLDADNLYYVADTESKDLLPLKTKVIKENDEDKLVKEENFFSAFSALRK